MPQITEWEFAADTAKRLLAAQALTRKRKALPLTEIFTNAAAGYTADEQMQERIVKELWNRAGRR